MKNLKLRFGLFSLLAMLIVSVFFTSCGKEELDDPAKTAKTAKTVEEVEEVDESSFANFQKELVITDEKGLSKINVTVSGEDESILNQIKTSDFKVVPIFVKPETTDKDFHDSSDGSPKISDEQGPDQTGVVPAVNITVDNVELEEGAIGYKIEVTQNSLNRGWILTNWYTTYNNVGKNSLRL